MDSSRLIGIVLFTAIICCSCSLGYITQEKKPHIEITTPKEKDYVEFRSIVSGNSSATNGSGLNAYVLIWPIEGRGPWYVQQTTTFNDGEFYSKAYFGGDPARFPEDIGTTYKIVAIITDETLNTGKIEEFPHVNQSQISKVVIVIRS